MQAFNVPEEVPNQISINNPVCKYDNNTYVLVPTGVKNIYEILRRKDDWLVVYSNYINYTTCEHTNHYLLKDGRIFTRNEIKNAIEELKHLLINDLINEAKKIKFDWENISNENDLHDKEDLTTISRHLNLSRIFDETKYNYVFLKIESLDEALSKYINDNIFSPKNYYNTDYESAIINIALLWISNQISTNTAIYRFYELHTLIQLNERNQELIEQNRLRLIEDVKIILYFYADVDNNMKAQKNLYQYLLNNEIKTVKIKVKNQLYKINTNEIIRLLRGIEVPIGLTIINFDDIETITYRKKEIYQKQ